MTFDPMFSQMSDVERRALANGAPDAKRPPEDETPGQYVRRHLCKKVFVTKQTEVILEDGNRELVDIEYAVLPMRDIQRMREAAATRMRDTAKSIGESVHMREIVDSISSDELSVECVYKACFEPCSEGTKRIFPTIEDVKELGSGNLMSFAKMFWYVQGLYSVSRVQLSPDDLKFWENYITEGLKDGGNLDFLVASLSRESIQQLLLHLGSRLSTSQSASV